MTEAPRSITLTLLLTAGAIVFLFCLVFPPIDGRRPARRTICWDNLHNIGLALHNYHDAHESFPPAYSSDARGTPMHSWRTYLLPYVDLAPLYNMYNLQEPWNGPANAALADSVGALVIYQCVADTAARDAGQPWTSYLAIVGPHTAWPGDRPARISEFTDGVANTALIVEAHNTGIPWMEPRDLHVTQMAPTVNPDSGQGISSPHEGGAFVMFADGAVRFIADDTDPETLRRLIERDDGEEVGDF